MYDKSETTYENLSARRIQICLVHFCVIHFHLFFIITFQIMSEQKCTTQNQIRLTKYSCAEVSGPSEAPRFVGKLILIFQGNQADVRALDNRMFARTNES